MHERVGVGIGRARGYRHFPGWVTAVVLCLGILTLMLGTACRRGVPAVDLGPKPPAARGTLTGIVRGPEGTLPIADRTIDIVNDVTGERRAVQTAANGGFTIELPAARYRLELRLKDGETLVRRPGVVALDAGDSGSHIEFVVSSTRLARPRGPAYRLDNGLGAPIA